VPIRHAAHAILVPPTPADCAWCAERTRGVPSMAELNGRYRILGVVGTGGMGTVYKAADIQLGDRIVAVKELSATGLSPVEAAEVTAAFHQEALLLAKLQHPSLPGIHDHFTEGGQWYLVMDFIEGQTLEEMLQHTGRPGLPVAEVLRIADELCAVLDYLHRQQPPIIFRDLKPSNVMVTPTGRLVLIDFGIARLFKPGQAHDTVAFGSSGYAAPEQFGKAQTTVQSDIFSLGVVLHQLLTGMDPTRKPFAFVPVRPSNPQISPALEALILQMVQLDEGKRPPSISWVRNDLQQIASQASTGQSPTPAPHQPVQVPHAFALSAHSQSSLPAPRHRFPVRIDRGRRGVLVPTLIGTLLGIVCIVALACSALSGIVQGVTPSASSLDTPSATIPDQGTLNSDENTVSSDLSSLGYDVGTLAQDSDFGNALAVYAKDWAQMQTDYQREQSDYRQGCGDGGSNAGVVSYDASVVSYDLSVIQYDDSTLTYDESSMNTDVKQVQSDMATVQTDLQTLKNDTGGSYTDSSVASSVNGADTGLAAAQQQLDSSNKALKSADSQARTYDNEAAQLNKDAHNLASSMHC
jgi:hypothetical protein